MKGSCEDHIIAITLIVSHSLESDTCYCGMI